MNLKIDGPAVCRCISCSVAVSANRESASHLYQVLPKNMLAYLPFRQLRSELVVDDSIPFIDARGPQLISKPGRGHSASFVGNRVTSTGDFSRMEGEGGGEVGREVQ